MKLSGLEPAPKADTPALERADGKPGGGGRRDGTLGIISASQK